jgi:hypothetical protein
VLEDRVLAGLFLLMIFQYRACPATMQIGWSFWFADCVGGGFDAGFRSLNDS